MAVQEKEHKTSCLTKNYSENKLFEAKTLQSNETKVKSYLSKNELNNSTTVPLIVAYYL